ncbi:MAG: hypothetical protein ACYCOS_00725 [Sulfobacillus sp.]
MSRHRDWWRELPYGRAVRFAAVAFVAGGLLVLPSQLATPLLDPALDVAVVMVVVAVGVAADMVGVASTRAKEQPFLSRAAKRTSGARQSLYLVRHADRVATVMSDLVGDTTGTVAGALAAAMAVRLAEPKSIAVVTAIAVGVLSAVTVGLKALSKYLAVHRADSVVTFAGRLLATVGFDPPRSKG